jgi:hypothetical protein
LAGTAAAISGADRQWVRNHLDVWDRAGTSTAEVARWSAYTEALYSAFDAASELPAAEKLELQQEAIHYATVREIAVGPQGDAYETGVVRIAKALDGLTREISAGTWETADSERAGEAPAASDGGAVDGGAETFVPDFDVQADAASRQVDTAADAAPREYVPEFDFKADADERAAENEGKGAEKAERVTDRGDTPPPGTSQRDAQEQPAVDAAADRDDDRQAPQGAGAVATEGGADDQESDDDDGEGGGGGGGSYEPLTWSDVRAFAEKIFGVSDETAQAMADLVRERPISGDREAGELAAQQQLAAGGPPAPDGTAASPAPDAGGIEHSAGPANDAAGREPSRDAVASAQPPVAVPAGGSPQQTSGPLDAFAQPAAPDPDNSAREAPEAPAEDHPIPSEDAEEEGEEASDVYEDQPIPSEDAADERASSGEDASAGHDAQELADAREQQEAQREAEEQAQAEEQAHEWEAA